MLEKLKDKYKNRDNCGTFYYIKEIYLKIISKNKLFILFYPVDKLLAILFKKNTNNKKFCIIFFPRSGSNLLATILDEHPEISCLSEPYNPRGISLITEKNKIRIPILIRNMFPLFFLQRIWNITSNYKATGFKIMKSQNHLVFSEILNDKNIKKIVVFRNNFLRKYVSHNIALINGEWWSLGEASNKIKIKFQFKKFVDYYNENIRELNEIKKTLSKNNQNYYLISYEEITGPDKVKHFKDILEYLYPKLNKKVKLDSPLKKQNSNDLRDLVENYDEMKSKLSGTKFEWMLE